MYVMASFVDWWGLSLPQTLLIVAVILVILDVCFQSDLLTLIAYTLMTLAVAYWLPLHPLYRVLVGLLVWGGLVYLHYALWRDCVAYFVNRVIAPTRYRTGPKGLVGRTGTVKEIDGNKMVSVQGDLWSFSNRNDLPSDSRVKIIGERDGVLEVKKLKETS